MAHISKSTIIHAPVAEVTATAFDPSRWHTWFVGLSEPERVEGTGQAGTVVKHKFLMAGIQFPVTTRVLRADRTSNPAYWESIIEGPLNGSHKWTYSPTAEGTRVTAETEYTIPGAVLGKFLDRLIIERIMERVAEQTLDNMKLICEAVKA